MLHYNHETKHMRFVVKSVNLYFNA